MLVLFNIRRLLQLAQLEKNGLLYISSYIPIILELYTLCECINSEGAGRP